MTLPVPDQLSVQLGKCKTVRDVEYHKSREKTAEVSVAVLQRSVVGLWTSSDCNGTQI